MLSIRYNIKLNERVSGVSDQTSIWGVSNQANQAIISIVSSMSSVSICSQHLLTCWYFPFYQMKQIIEQTNYFSNTEKAKPNKLAVLKMFITIQTK